MNQQTAQAAKHTPGEWMAALDSGNPSGSQWGVKVRGSFWLCDCFDNGGPVRVVSYGEANARMMAAAPNLLTALEAALRVINNECDPDEYAEPLAVIHAAIAKALGEPA